MYCDQGKQTGTHTILHGTLTDRICKKPPNTMDRIGHSASDTEGMCNVGSPARRKLKLYVMEVQICVFIGGVVERA